MNNSCIYSLCRIFAASRFPAERASSVARLSFGPLLNFQQTRCRALPRIGLACLLTFCTAMGVSAQTAPLPAAQTITQRDINVMAASVEDARAALIDNAGLRQPGEDLNRYLRRIALPLPGETPAVYQTRIRRYLDLLTRSVDATRPHKRLPVLRDTDPANRAVWEHTMRDLQQFPARVAHTRAAWQRAQHAAKVSSSIGSAKAESAKSSANQSVLAARFDSELAQTVSLLIAIDDGLRDARP